MNKPLVSVIIPAFNAEKYIAETVKSVLSQTYPNIEVLIIDDGSTDNTFEVAQLYRAKNIKVFSQVNKGASAARNNGLKSAGGKYIQFLDADDFLSEDKIELQVELLEQYEGWIAVCNTVHFFDGEVPLSQPIKANPFLFSTDDPIEFLINLYGGNGKAGMIQPNAWLSPRPVIDKAGYWNEHISLDDDGEFFFRVLLASNGVAYCEKGVNYYRKFRKSNNLSSSKSFDSRMGAFQAACIKCDALLTKTMDPRARKAMTYNFMEMAVVNYPMHREITRQALNKIKELGGTHYEPVVGGRLLEVVKRVFGWKAARYLSHLNNSLF